MSGPWSAAAATPRLCLLPALLLAPLACGRERPPAAERGPAPPPVVAPAPPEDVAMDQPTAPNPWPIAPGQVGALALDRPVPPALANDALAAAYQPRFIADGVAEDGFRLADPPLTFAIADGPFAQLDRKGAASAPPPVDVLRPRATAAVAAGALVVAIRVHGRGPATAAGLGVGSTLAELRAAYPQLRLGPLPPTEGDRDGDGCVARAPELPGVGFVFANCKAAEDGAAVKRVDLWSTR